MNVEHAFGLFATSSGPIAVPAECLVQVLEGGLRRGLPGAPRLAPGVVVFQEQLVPLLDLQLVAVAGSDEGGQSLVVICTTRRGLVGLPACGVGQVAPEEAGCFEPVVAMEHPPWQTGVFQFQNQHYQVIDLDRLVEVLPG